MKLRSLRPILAATALACAGAAQAAVMDPPVVPDGNGYFTLTDSTGPHAPVYYDMKVDPTTAPLPVIYFDTNPPSSQNPGSLAALMAPYFDADASTLTLASSCDKIVGGGCANVTSSATQFSVAGATFDYLALHFGGGELFFHWAQPQSSMTLTVPGGFPGLSDYRAYLGPLATPVPGALGLFLSALGLLGLGRKFARPAAAEPTPA